MENDGLESLRRLVADCIDKNLLPSACFYADKLVTLSEGAAEDVFLLAQAYLLNGEHPRALALLRAEGLVDASPRFTLLAATCLLAAQQWEEALALLQEAPPVDVRPGCAPDVGHAYARSVGPRAFVGPRAQRGRWRRLSSVAAKSHAHPSRVATDSESVSVASAVWLLRGRTYLALENRPMAARCFKARARCSLRLLVRHNSCAACRTRSSPTLCASRPSSTWWAARC
jgi:anaphase-promoting complex subunit 6